MLGVPMESCAVLAYLAVPLACFKMVACCLGV